MNEKLISTIWSEKLYRISAVVGVSGSPQWGAPAVAVCHARSVTRLRLAGEPDDFLSEIVGKRSLFRVIGCVAR